MAKIAAHGLVLVLCATAWSCSRAEDSVQNKQAAQADEIVPSEQAIPSAHGSAHPARSPWPSSTPFTEQLRKAHEEADSARSKKEKVLSAERLLALFDAVEAENSPHLSSVRQDLAARAADLLLEESPIRAKQSAERGLNLSSSPSVLRANLLLVLANAEETLGNQEAAKRALLEALSINEELFQSEMETP